MPRANGEGFLDLLSETVEALLDSDDETNLPEAIRKVARHPLFENHGQIVKRTIERWKVKTAAKMSKLIEALELSPIPTLEPQHSVNTSSPVLPSSLQMVHEGIGHQNLVWKGGKQFIAETQNFGKDSIDKRYPAMTIFSIVSNICVNSPAETRRQAPKILAVPSFNGSTR